MVKPERLREAGLQAGPEAGKGVEKGSFRPVLDAAREKPRADLLLLFHTPGDRAAWSELWELTQAQGQRLQDAEVTLRVHSDLLEALRQVQV